jgi:hypothetical protein
MPGIAVGLGAGEIHQVFRKLVVREGHDDLQGGIGALAGLQHVVPPAARGVGQQIRTAREQVGEEAHVVRMVGDHQEVQWARELDRLSGGADDLLTSGEAVRVAGRQSRPERTRVHRKRGMQVRVAKERPGGEIPIDIGRVSRRLLDFGQVLLGGRARFGRQGRYRPDQNAQSDQHDGP